MRYRLLTRVLAGGAAAILAAGCTMGKQDAPPLTGPSEMGTSIAVAITPDTLPQDGASQSLVTVTARDANGQPVRSLSLRAEILVGGSPIDFGSLSARNLVTGSDGRATLVYTAPPAPAGPATDPFILVEIGVTPLGTDYANAFRRIAAVRLVPTGVIVPPDGLVPAFTMTPGAPLESDAIFFDASTSRSNSSNPITTYAWDFGDGRNASGRTATHSYSTAGNYVVSLTVGDSYGRTASTARQITVGGAVRPTASFIFSPSPSQLNQPVHFNATASTATAGRRIVSYTWDFGEGTVRTTSDPRIDFTYTLARTYVVSLIVTDDTGKTSLPATQSVSPAPLPLR